MQKRIREWIWRFLWLDITRANQEILIQRVCQLEQWKEVTWEEAYQMSPRSLVNDALLRIGQLEGEVAALQNRIG